MPPFMDKPKLVTDDHPSAPGRQRTTSSRRVCLRSVSLVEELLDIFRMEGGPLKPWVCWLENKNGS